MLELEHLNLGELCDLLVQKTTELLKLMEQKAKSEQLQPLKKDVEQIQEAIRMHKHKSTRS
jgi:hypothetical protein